MIKRKRIDKGGVGKALPVFTEKLKWLNPLSSGQHLNEKLGDLEESRFKRKYSKVINELFKEIHFTYEETECLVLMYYHLVKSGAPGRLEITKAEVKQMLHDTFDITDPIILELILPVIDNVPGPDFSMQSWLRTMSLFLRGSLEEKIQYCFQVYDLARKNLLSSRMLITLMTGCVITDDIEHSKDVVEILIKKMDRHRNGGISYPDFKRAVMKQPLLLECFGQCLPTREAVHSVLCTFTPYTGKL